MIITERKYRAINDPEKRFHDHQNLLSKNADISVSLSIRDLGKSFDAARMIRGRVKNRGVSCAWMRWSLNEVGAAQDAVLKDEDPAQWEKHKLDNSNVIYWTYLPSGGCIYFIALAQSVNLKGFDHELDWLIYDEFIPEIYDNRTRKLQEFQRFHSVYWTLVRKSQNFRVLLIANCISWFQGYFEAWNVRPFPQGEIHVYKQSEVIDGEEYSLTVAVENVLPTPAMIRRIAKHALVGGKTYSHDYFEGATKDRMDFIAVCPVLSTPLHNAEWYMSGQCYSFRVYDNLIYWCRTSPRPGIPRYTTSKTDLKADIIRDRQFGEIFEALYDSARLRFADGNVEQAVISMIWAARQTLYGE